MRKAKRKATRKVTNILWDVDDKKDLARLPKEIMIPESIEADEIDDYISDVTGFCHRGYELTEDDSHKDGDGAGNQ